MLSQNASHLQSDNKPFRGQVEVEEVELQHGLPILCDRCQNQMLCDRCHKPILCDRCHTPILRADTMQPPDFQLAPVNMYRHPYVPTFPTFPGDHKSDHFKEAAWWQGVRKGHAWLLYLKVLVSLEFNRLICELDIYVKPNLESKVWP